MNSLQDFATLLLTVAILSVPVSAQFPSQVAQPSPEQMKSMQKEGMELMKPLIEEAFGNSDTDDSDSLNKEELIEFTLELLKAQTKFMADQGMVVPQPSEAYLSRLREEMEQRLDEAFKRTDIDESGDISQEEVLKALSGDAFSGEDEVEDFEVTSDGYGTGSNDDLQESATPLSAQFPQGAQPSPEHIERMQEHSLKMMKRLIEEAFDNSDADDSDSLDKQEMLEFSVEYTKGQIKAMTESMTARGLQTLPPSEDEFNQMKEIVKQDLDEAFKRTDTDESGDISLDEVLEAMLGYALSGEDGEEDFDAISGGYNTGSTDNSQESATPLSTRFPPQGAQPSSEQIEGMQEEGMELMKSLIEEAFEKNDANDSDSLDKDEMLELLVQLYKAQRPITTERGFPVPELSEAQLSQLREEGKKSMSETFKQADTDESGDISKEEFLKILVGKVDPEEDQEFEGTSDEDNTNASSDSKESSTDAR